MEFLSSLTLFNAQTPFLLEKRITLLLEIQKVGSILQAAKNVPMSYKAAWDAIDSINNLCPYPVVTKETGGKGGGGATLTEYGKNLIKTYQILQKEHQKFLSNITKITDFNTGALKSLQRFNMELSARNQIQGIVDFISHGNVNAQIHIKLKSANSLISVITNNSAENMDIKIGDEVIAIFKSSSVLLSTNSDLNISARNKFEGEISSITKGDINSEVVLDIGSCDKIASVITTESLKNLNLKLGDKLWAIIKSSDVMIGK